MALRMRRSTSDGVIAPVGELSLRVVRDEEVREVRPPKRLRPGRVSIWRLIRDGFPMPDQTREVNLWRLRNCWRLVTPIARVWVLQRFAGAALVSQLRLTLERASGERVALGLASMKVVTTAGVNYLVDALQNSVEPENFNYHGFGTDNTAENSSDTALGAELTTEYVVNSTRPTGTAGEGASANVYRTTGSLAPDSGGTLAITEHGVFSASSSGTLLDRSVFSAVNVVASADSLEAQYDLTLAAGS